ncbi:MAG TPA: glutathione S-transferase family protein [Rhizomicrobium sp.]|jgi:glutathione S-transferase|nr:glutathione S-transferase family protein [Rhizomicrobium sp.]
MTIKLHVFPLSPRAFKVMWAATHLGIAFEPVLVDFTKGAHRTSEFACLNPNMRMPVLEDGDYSLWESNAILQYLAAQKPETGLLPEDIKARSQIVKWQFWDSAHWDPACAIFAFENYVKKLFQRGEPSVSEIARGEEMFARLGPVLEAQLQKHRYVAGDALTLADFSLGAMNYIAEQAKFPLESYRGIQRWAADLKSLPSWQKTATDAPAILRQG